MVKRKSEEMTGKTRTKRAKRFLEKREPKLVGLFIPTVDVSSKLQAFHKW